MALRGLEAVVRGSVLLLVLCSCGSEAVAAQYAPPPLDPTWTPIPAGEYEMGTRKSEFCRRETVGVSTKVIDAFEIQTYEVTQGQFEAVMGYNPSFASSCDHCPVDSVSWHEAAAYANALAAAEGTTACYDCSGSHEAVACTPLPADTCDGPRLPTEAQWEYAARAGTLLATYAGRITSCMSRDEVADQIAWYKANSRGQPREAGKKKPNPWGLHDVLGNVAEWTEAIDAGGFGVLRGGSWYHNAERARAAGRLRTPADRHLSYAGIRLVRPARAGGA